MTLFNQLIGTDYGLMTLIGLLFITFMGLWFWRFFVKKMNEPQK